MAFDTSPAGFHRASLMRACARGLLLGALGLGLAACGGWGERPEADIAASQVTSIGVNSYLWRACLETLSFMPLTQADSAGGVIVTDWYANPQNPGERMKLSVSILDQDLRADALHIAASREVLQGGALGLRAGPGGHRAEARGHHPDQGARLAPLGDQLIALRCQPPGWTLGGEAMSDT